MSQQCPITNFCMPKIWTLNACPRGKGKIIHHGHRSTYFLSNHASCHLSSEQLRALCHTKFDKHIYVQGAPVHQFALRVYKTMSNTSPAYRKFRKRDIPQRDTYHFSNFLWAVIRRHELVTGKDLFLSHWRCKSLGRSTM